jgi:ubiquinone/menaquinone biosynthesis C-methylase UbiE
VSSAHELPWPDDSFDLVHTSMMFSSITDAGFRRTIAAEMWRVLRPSGHVLWFDFILNPLNRHTSGMWKSDIRRLFPEAEWRQTRRICLPPPVERLLLRVSPSFAGLLERLKFLNSYYLVLLRKNARAGPLETG